MKAALVLVATALLLAGCVHADSFEYSMNRQVNVLTYDEAIQTWGPPSSEAVGDRVIVARWSKTAGVSTLHSVGYLFESLRSSSLTLTFGKETKRMISWSTE